MGSSTRLTLNATFVAFIDASGRNQAAPEDDMTQAFHWGTLTIAFLLELSALAALAW